MGNSGLPSMSAIPMDVSVQDLKQTNVIKIDGKNHVVLRESKTNTLYVQYFLPFDTDQDYRATHKALSDIKKMARTNILKVRCVVVEDRRLTCSTSSFKVYTDYHEKNLDEIVRAGQVPEHFPTESRFWKFLFSLAEVLGFFAEHQIDCNFVHPRSIFYNLNNERFGLIHPVFFKENNFTEAMAGNEHFCSPELYYQILSRNRKFMLVENDKSNSFSLGLIALWVIYSGGRFDWGEVYNKEVITVGMAKIKQMTRDLKARGFSELFVQVLLDLTSEFEHVRLSPGRLVAALSPWRQQLEAETFAGHAELMDEYAKRTNMNDNYELNGKMSHAFGFDGHDDINVSQNLNSEEVVKNLKGKAQPFTNKYVNQENSF